MMPLGYMGEGALLHVWKLGVLSLTSWGLPMLSPLPLALLLSSVGLLQKTAIDRVRLCGPSSSGRDLMS